jgi:hypothetical protein
MTDWMNSSKNMGTKVLPRGRFFTLLEPTVFQLFWPDDPSNEKCQLGNFRSMEQSVVEVSTISDTIAER